MAVPPAARPHRRRDAGPRSPRRAAAGAGAPFAHSREHLAPPVRVRRTGFTDLPRVISCKIRRAELRDRKTGQRNTPEARLTGEYQDTIKESQ